MEIKEARKASVVERDGHIIIAIVILVCGTAIVITSLVLDRTLPELLVVAGVSFVSSVVTYIFGQRSKSNGGDRLH